MFVSGVVAQRATTPLRAERTERSAYILAAAVAVAIGFARHRNELRAKQRVARTKLASIAQPITKAAKSLEAKLELKTATATSLQFKS